MNQALLHPGLHGQQCDETEHGQASVEAFCTHQPLSADLGCGEPLPVTLLGLKSCRCMAMTS